MINNEQLQQQLMSHPEVLEAIISGDGYHYQLTIVSDAFIDKSKIARQQWVYGLLKEEITSGKIHALSMKTLTKTEWEKEHG